MEGSPPTLSVVPQSDYASDGIVNFDFSATLADENGNAIDFNFSNFYNSRLHTSKVDSFILASDNSYIDLEFNDQIYGNDNVTGTMNIDDILVKIIPNGSQMDSCTVTSLIRTDSNFLTGGEINIRVNLEYNHTPKMGMNLLSLNLPMVFIYDESGNQYSGICIHGYNYTK